jgi:preprotein translocase subunit SecY
MSQEIDELTEQREKDYQMFIKCSKYVTVIIAFVLTVVIVRWIAP